MRGINRAVVTGVVVLAGAAFELQPVNGQNVPEPVMEP